jgi:hypothetical protein
MRVTENSRGLRRNDDARGANKKAEKSLKAGQGGGLAENDWESRYS